MGLPGGELGTAAFGPALLMWRPWRTPFFRLTLNHAGAHHPLPARAKCGDGRGDRGLTVGIPCAGDVGLGGYPAVSLKDARSAARAAREKAASGTDPIAERKCKARAQAAERDAEAAERTVRAAAVAAIKAQAPGWRNGRTADL